jgi:hypothetical protein
MKRQQLLPATTIVALAFGTLTRGQKAYEAKKLGKAIDQIDANMKVKLPGNIITAKQLQSLRADGTMPANPGAITHKSGAQRRHRRGSASSNGAYATTTSGSAMKTSEMKIADYNLRGFPMKLIYGNGQQVAKQLGTLPNAAAIAMVAIDDVKVYGKYPWAAALYVDGFAGNFENAKQSLPRQFAEGIIEAVNGKSVMKQTQFLNFLAKYTNGVCEVNGSKTLKGTPAVRAFLAELERSVFGKGWNVRGTHGTEQTNVVYFLGDNGPRTGYIWAGENFSYAPSAFPEAKQTHHTVGSDFKIEFVPGTNTFKGANAQQLWDAVHNNQAPEMHAVTCEKIDGKIADLSVVTTTPMGFVAIASLEGGKNGYQPLLIDLSAQKIALSPVTKGVSTEIANNLGGWITRFSSQGITLTSQKGDAIVQRLPLNYQPTELRGMVTELYAPTHAAA